MDKSQRSMRYTLTVNTKMAWRLLVRWFLHVCGYRWQPEARGAMSPQNGATEPTNDSTDMAAIWLASACTGTHVRDLLDFLLVVSMRERSWASRQGSVKHLVLAKLISVRATLVASTSSSPTQSVHVKRHPGHPWNELADWLTHRHASAVNR